MDGFNKAIGEEIVLIQDASLMSWLSRVCGAAERQRRHGRKIFIEIGVCHTNWISIMVVFGLIDLLINQRSGYFERILPLGTLANAVPRLFLRAFVRIVEVTVDGAGCESSPAVVQSSTPVELVFTLPSQLDGKKNLQSFDDLWSLQFWLLMEVRLFRLSLRPRQLLTVTQ